MATLFSDIKADITHIQALVQAQVDTLGHDKSFDRQQVLGVQAENCKRRLRQLKALSAEECLELQDLLFKGPWSAEEKTNMVNILNDASRDEDGTGSEGKQYCPAFVAFLTKSDVQKLSNPDMGNMMKIQVLAERTLNIGFFRPTEPGYKIILASGCANGMTVQPSENLPFLNELKRLVRAGAKKRPKPSPWLLRFPNSPAELPPALLESAYAADDQPVSLESVAEAAALKASVDLGCRKSKKGLHEAPRPSSMALAPVATQAPGMVTGMIGMQGEARTMPNQLQTMFQMCQMMASNPMLCQMMNMMSQAPQPQQHQQDDIPLTMFGSRGAAGSVHSRASFSSAANPNTPEGSPKNDSQELDSLPRQAEETVQTVPLFDVGVPEQEGKQPPPNKKAESLQKAASLQVAKQAKLMEKAFDERAMKKPAACNPKAKAVPTASKPETKAVKKDQEGGLKMDRKNLHSRTYTAAKLKFLKQGFKLEEACTKASQVAADELRKHGFEPHPKKRPNKKK